jgi:hypothetical protein
MLIYLKAKGNMMTRLELIAESVKAIRQELQDLELRMDAREKEYELLALQYSNEKLIDFDAQEFSDY